MSERTYYDGKYTVKARIDGGLEFLRHGEPWPAAANLRFNNLVGVMFREQLDADAEIAALKQQLADVTRERNSMNAYISALEMEKRPDKVKEMLGMVDAEPLRAQLAAAQASEAKACKEMTGGACGNWEETVGFVLERADILNGELGVAQASEALLRGALEEVASHHESGCSDVVWGRPYHKPRLERVRRALATPPSDAVKRIMAMERALAHAEMAMAETLMLDSGTGPFGRRKLGEALKAIRAIQTTKEHGDGNEKTE